jgi:hypothetical protein
LVCEFRSQLAERFAIATRKYAEAAVRLGGVHIQQTAYPELFENAEVAQRQAETARDALKAHIDEHQCGSGETP